MVPSATIMRANLPNGRISNPHRYPLRSSAIRGVVESDSSTGSSSGSSTAPATGTVGNRASTRRRSSMPSAPLTNSNLKTPAPTRKRPHRESTTTTAAALSEVKAPAVPSLPSPEKCDFRKNLLQPPKITPNPVPRFKRMYVSEPNKCMEIREPVMNMCYEQEDRYATTDDFFAAQPFVNPTMRAILCDWLVDVCRKMQLDRPTIWLTMSLVDRTLQKIVIKRSRLQLLGVAALSLACKMEEVHIPSPRDFVYITDRAYDREDLMAMELQVLAVVNYEVHVPTAYHFLVHYLELIHASDVTHNLALYYAERSLMYDCSRCKPTLFAAAALCAALLRQTSQSEDPTCSTVPSEDVSDLLELCKAAAASDREASSGGNNSRSVSHCPQLAPPPIPHNLEGIFFAGPMGFFAGNFLTVWTSPPPSSSWAAIETAATTSEEQTQPEEEPPTFAVGPRVMTSAYIWGLGPLSIRGTLPGFSADIDKHSAVLGFMGQRIKRRLLGRLRTLLHLPGTETTAKAVEAGAEVLAAELRHIDTTEIHALAAVMLNNARREKEPDGRLLDAVVRKYACKHHHLAVASLPVPSAEYVATTLGVPLPVPELEAPPKGAAQASSKAAAKDGEGNRSAANPGATKRRKLKAA